MTKFGLKVLTHKALSFCRQEKGMTADVRSLRAPALESLTTVNELKIIIFVLNYLTVLVYSKTIIHPSVGG